jgi:phosphoribosylformylglycinamidine (FGAM) synthase-like enzyme
MCEADPYEGGKQAVAEAWRNLTAVGADAARDHRQPQLRQSAAPEIMGQIVAAIEGHGRGLPRARLPGRERQRLALQRDQRRGDSADARPPVATI